MLANDTRKLVTVKADTGTVCVCYDIGSYMHIPHNVCFIGLTVLGVIWFSYIAGIYNLLAWAGSGLGPIVVSESPSLLVFQT